MSVFVVVRFGESVHSFLLGWEAVILLAGMATLAAIALLALGYLLALYRTGRHAS